MFGQNNQTLIRYVKAKINHALTIVETMEDKIQFTNSHVKTSSFGAIFFGYLLYV